MKLDFNHLWVPVFTVIAVLGLTPAAYAASASDGTSIKQVQQEAKDLMHALKSYSVRQKDAAVKKTKDALNSIDQRIDALEARVDKNWDKMDKAAREKARASLKSLRKQRMEAAEWYGGLKNSSGDAWEQMKKGFSEAYASLHEAWNKAEKEFSDK